MLFAHNYYCDIREHMVGCVLGGLLWHALGRASLGRSALALYDTPVLFHSGLWSLADWLVSEFPGLLSGSRLSHHFQKFLPTRGLPDRIFTTHRFPTRHI